MAFAKLVLSYCFSLLFIVRTDAVVLPQTNALLSSSTTPTAGSNAAPTVTIAPGVLIGSQVVVPNQPSITALANAYLGVPFAKSPPERFSPPEAAPAWSSPLVAQARKPACIQQFSALGSGAPQERLEAFFNNPGGEPPEESEDCLYINVWTPANVTVASKKPVMFWIFGGNLQFGYGGASAYDGSSLAATQDVVVVTFNYRTNIFGFSNSPEIPHGLQNAGLLDQRFALRWVTQNIAQFGGDPLNVMLFGQSAGGESVKQLLANPPSPLSFRSAVLQSQQSVFLSLTTGEQNYQNVLSHFGCTNIQCLRQVDAFTIRDYVDKAGINFPPVDDDVTHTSDVRQSITSGRFAKVPLLLGTNLNENRVFFAVLGLTDGTTAVPAVLDFFGLNNTLGNTLVAKYAEQGINDLYDVADRINTDLAFTCTTALLANFLVLSGYQVHRYRYDPSFPSTTLFSNSGAYHSSEITEVFGTYPLPATQQQIKLSAFMQRTWADFARGKAPSWPQLGRRGTFELGVLGKAGSSGVTVVSTLTSDYACPVYAPIEELLGLAF